MARSVRPLAAALLCALVPLVARAQHVRGRVVDADGGRPVAGALATLVAADGRRVAPTLTGADGSYVVAAPSAGAFGVRVDLIGYETWQSAPVTLGAADTVVVDVRLPLRRVELAAVTVREQARCEARPHEAPQLIGVWEEIRRALAISDLSTRRGLVVVDLNVRHTELIDRRVVAIRGETMRATGAQPWRARSAAELARRGYVRREGDAYVYVGLDVPILLAPEFVETHCFRAVRRVARGERQLGLAFEPAVGRTLPDVAGTLWLDERTSRLRRVDFSLVNLPDSVARLGAPGGTLEFARHDDGAWYVRRWTMRREVRDRGRLVAVESVGDAAPARARVTGQPPAVLTGVVVDSTELAGEGGGEALAGAEVHVPGTAPVTTDSLGRFRVEVEDVPGYGLEYVVRFEHPRFAALGLGRVEHRATLRPRMTTSLVAAVPSVPTLLAALCAGDAVPAERARAGILIGRASLADATAAAGARVVAEWPSDAPLGDGAAARVHRRSAVVEPDGRFRLCPVPLGTAVRVRVEAGAADGGVRGPETEIALPASGIAEIHVSGAPDA